jgi:hypothetical protein
VEAFSVLFLGVEINANKDGAAPLSDKVLSLLHGSGIKLWEFEAIECNIGERFSACGCLPFKTRGLPLGLQNPRSLQILVLYSILIFWGYTANARESYHT